MKNWITKYVLLLSVLLLGTLNPAAAHSNSALHADSKEAFEQSSITHLTSINSISSPIFKKSENRFTTSEVDEEEITSSAKKFLKGNAFASNSFTGHRVSGHFSSIYQKRLYVYKQLTSYSPYRLYIKFRVIRL